MHEFSVRHNSNVNNGILPEPGYIKYMGLGFNKLETGPNIITLNQTVTSTVFSLLHTDDMNVTGH